MFSQNPSAYILGISGILALVTGYMLQDFVKSKNEIKVNQNSLRRKFLKNAFNLIEKSGVKIDTVHDETISAIFRTNPDFESKLIVTPIEAFDFKVAFIAALIPAMLLLIIEDGLYLSISSLFMYIVSVYYLFEATLFWSKI